MKTSFLIFSLLLLTISCNKEETTTQNNYLIGSWSLVSFEPGFSQTKNYNIGDIIWSINSSNISATINIIEDDPRLPLNQNGSYIYNIISTDTITIDNKIYKYEIGNQTFKLSTNPESDGIMLTFQKIN
ncbi:hypothetical protein [Lutibacter sp.]